jgi:copper chaperone CopZ
MNAMVRQIALALALLLISTGAWAAERAYSLVVDGLVCPLCAYSAKRNLSAIEGVRQIEIDYRTGLATVTMADGAALEEAEVRAAIDAAGFRLLDFEEIGSQPK